MKPKNSKTLSEWHAIDLLQRQRDARLIRLHTHAGPKWFVATRNGGEITDASAQLILSRADCIGGHDALWPDAGDQTYRLFA